MESPLLCFHFSRGQTDGQHLALGRRQPSSTQALRPRTRLSNHALLRGFLAAVGRMAWPREPEGHEVGTEWRIKALRTQVRRRRRPGGLPCPGQDRQSGGCGPRCCGLLWTEVARPGGIRAHRPALFACHTSFGFIAFVQHPIVWFPFVPLSALLPFISQPAWLFSFLLSEVPERKVLFSAV